MFLKVVDPMDLDSLAERDLHCNFSLHEDFFEACCGVVRLIPMQLNMRTERVLFQLALQETFCSTV